MKYNRNTGAESMGRGSKIIKSIMGWGSKIIKSIMGWESKIIESIIGVYLCFYLVFLVYISISVYSKQTNFLTRPLADLLQDTLIRSLIYIGSAGGLGGVVYCMRGFYEHAADKTFDISYLSWYFFRPLISTVTGIIVYFFFVGGLLSVGSVSEQKNPSNIMFFCSVAFLAGFGFTQFYSKVDDLANTVFKPSKTTPRIFWSNPDDIRQGIALNNTQLNAYTLVPGTFAYTPQSGTILPAGIQTLYVVFIPTDSVAYNTASKSVTINVLKATPTITWNNPADIGQGTALNNTQLNAVATDPVTNALVAGTYTYNPVAGTVLDVGTRTLHVDFTPSDPATYNTASADVQINVHQ